MRHLCVALILLSICTPCCSKMRRLDRKQESKRNEYLIEKAKEVIMAFGPDYYRDYKEPVISDINTIKETFKDDPVLKDKKLFGRKYYTVTFLYDPSEENLKYNFSAIVEIWADDGQPAVVMFGSGRVQQFYATTYKDWIKKGIKESDIAPYIATEKKKITRDDLFKVVDDTLKIFIRDY